MKNKKSLCIILTVCISTIVIFGLFVLEQSSIQYASAGESSFNLIFKYGVGTKNELNTFKGTYTKDMISDPSITTNLSLSKEDLDKIYQKMIEIDFFDYPENFSIPPEKTRGILYPQSSYYFEVAYNSKIKKLSHDAVMTENDKAEKLGELIKLIINIIESKEEYKRLPPSRGGYQ